MSGNILTSTNIFSFVVVVTSSLLGVWHIRTWEAIKATKPTRRELDFAWRQTRRRIKVSAMLGLVGVAAFVSQFFDNPVLRIGIWAVVVMLVFWMTVLAAIDVVAIRRHFAQILSGQHAEQTKLHDEFQQMCDQRAEQQAETNDHDQA